MFYELKIILSRNRLTMIFHSKTKIDVNYSNKNLTSLFNSSVYFKRYPYLLSHNINYLDKNVLITKKVLIKNLLMQFSIDSDYFQKLSILNSCERFTG